MAVEKSGIKKKRILILVVMIPVFCAGIILSIITLNASKQAIYEEHDNYLYQLAGAIDHNTNTVMGRCLRELLNVSQNEEVIDALQKYVDNKENYDAGEDYGANGAFDGSAAAGEVAAALKSAYDTVGGYTARVLALDDSGFIASSDLKDSLNYNILSGDGTGMYWLIKDESSGVTYFGISYPSYVYGIDNLALIDVNLLYERSVNSSTYKDFWVVLYDTKAGLAISNKGQDTYVMLLSKSDALERSDGYCVIASYSEKSQTGSTVYTYTMKDDDGAETSESISSRLYVIPSQLSENDRFTIGVAINDEYLTKPMQRRNIQMILAALLIAFSAAFAVFYLLHSGKREEELATEIAALETKNQLTENLLNQEKELAHHQQLETIGTLTAGVAHEFNNLLSPIMANSFLILSENPEDSANYDNALEIYNASGRAKDLVSKISRLSRKSAADAMVRIYPNILVSNVLILVKNNIPANVEIATDFTSEGCILGDETMLEHTLINLVINAFHAMEPGGGTLTISTYDDKEGHTIIKISDTGTGIKEELLDSIFKPFFTTKEAGKGTGLGLAIARRTMENHGGTIEAVNNEGAGASFILTFNTAEVKEVTEEE